MLKAKLFLSYARHDLAAADGLFAALQRQQCLVWMDRHEILAGDDFVRALQAELAGSDGLVFLLTEVAAASSWCLAELHTALARGLHVIVVQNDDSARLPEALARWLRDVQTVSWSQALADLGPQIEVARRRRLRRWMLRGLLGAAAGGAVAMAGAAAVGSINRLDDERRREGLRAAVLGSTLIWSSGEVEARLQPVRDDPRVEDVLSQISNDATVEPIARTNAWQALLSMRRGRQTERRMYLPSIDWSQGRLADAVWANVTYGKGRIARLEATRMRMAGLVFGPAPTAAGEGLTLEGWRVDDSDAWFLRMDGTQLIDVEFTNCKFRGAQLDLGGGAGVRFISRAASQVFIGPDVCIFEDSHLLQPHPQAAPGVLDLATAEHEVLFDGVQFTRVRFDGHFKHHTFRNCHFSDCTFNAGLDPARLMATGQEVENAVVLDAATVRKGP